MKMKAADWFIPFAIQDVRTHILEFLNGHERRRFLRIFEHSPPYPPLSPSEWKFPVYWEGRLGLRTLIDTHHTIDRSQHMTHVQYSSSNYDGICIRGERSVTIHCKLHEFAWGRGKKVHIFGPPQEYFAAEIEMGVETLPNSFEECFDRELAVIHSRRMVVLYVQWTSLPCCTTWSFDWIEVLTAEVKQVRRLILDDCPANRTWLKDAATWLSPECQIGWESDTLNMYFETPQGAPEVYERIIVKSPVVEIPPTKHLTCKYHLVQSFDHGKWLDRLEFHNIDSAVMLDQMLVHCPRLSVLVVLNCPGEWQIGDGRRTLEQCKFDRWWLMRNRTTLLRIQVGQYVGDKDDVCDCRGMVTFHALRTPRGFRWRGVPPSIHILRGVELPVACGWLSSVHTLIVKEIPRRSTAKTTMHQTAWAGVDTLIWTEEDSWKVKRKKVCLGDYPVLKRVLVAKKVIQEQVQQWFPTLRVYLLDPVTDLNPYLIN